MKPIIPTFILAACLTLTSHGEVILGTTITGVNTSDTTAPLDATSIDWTTSGIATPSTTLRFIGGATSFLGGSASANFINPNVNIGNGGTWATTVALDLNPSTTIDLTNFNLNWVSTNSSGAAQTQTRSAFWTVSITGSTSGALGSVTKASTGAVNLGVNNVLFDLSSMPNLTTSEIYTLSLSVVENNTVGFFARLEDFTLSGNSSVVPEPTSALAGLVIAAGLLRRRRTA